MKQPFKNAVPSIRNLLARIEDLEPAKNTPFFSIATREELIMWAVTWVGPIQSLILELERTSDAKALAGDSQEHKRGLSVLAESVQRMLHLTRNWFIPSMPITGEFDPESTILYTYEIEQLKLGLRMVDRAASPSNDVKPPSSDSIEKHWPTITRVADGLGLNKGSVSRLIGKELRDNGKSRSERRIDPASVLEYCEAKGITYNET